MPTHLEAYIFLCQATRRSKVARSGATRSSKASSTHRSAGEVFLEPAADLAAESLLLRRVLEIHDTLLAPAAARLKACYIQRYLDAVFPGHGGGMAHKGMKFGIFLAPFHSVGENPTLALSRDMELIEWLDCLGYDEAWIGEHHSAGWELIASPEIFIAAAAERTRHIMLGSGVTSLPYHHPFLVAQRFVQLDHMTRGRVMLGCGPGALDVGRLHDGHRAGEPAPRAWTSRSTRSCGSCKCDEPVTMKTDWFELREARLHLAPYTDPHFPIAVASTITPSGHGRGQARPRRAVDRRRAARRAGGDGEAVEDRRGDRGQARQDHGPQELAHRRQHARRRGRRGGAAPGVKAASGTRP